MSQRSGRSKISSSTSREREPRHAPDPPATATASAPLKDFANELAEQMKRERLDVRREGKRETFTTYRLFPTH